MNFMVRNFKGKYFRDAMIMLSIMLAVFFITEKGISSSGIGLFVRKSIICSLVLYIVQIVVKERFFSKHWLMAHGLICWEYLYIFVQAVFINQGAMGQIYENEIFIGSYGAAGLIFLQYIQDNYVKNEFLVTVLDLPKVILTVIPVITFIHWGIYGYNIGFEEMMAVQQTSFREAAEWLAVYVGMLPVLVLLLGILAEFYVFHILRKKIVTRKFDYFPEKNRKKYLVIILAILSFYYPGKIITESDWTGQYIKAVVYEKNIAQYVKNMEQKSAVIEFRDNSMISSVPHTVVVVIGESANRDKLHAYNAEYPFADTPWMDKNKGNENFVFFANAYACQSMTLQVLEQALTEKSAYNDKELLEAMNFIDIAKAKGYKTYWITNLTGNNSGSFYGMIASRADCVYRENAEYDDNMLKFLTQINPAENNLIVFHGNGSHASYAARYPAEDAVFADGTVESEYANSIRYVDKFLESIYEFGINNLNLQCMFYFSDHGENLKTGHGPSDKDFVKVRIPVMIYTSPEYRKNNPELCTALYQHKENFFTNDMMYNTICGMLKAKSNFYDDKEDLSASDFAYHKDDLYTFGKKAKVIDDPALH